MLHGCMVYTERVETAAVSCGTSHVSAVKYTTSVDIQKRAIFFFVESGISNSDGMVDETSVA